MAKFRALISGGGGAGVSVAESMASDGRGEAVAFFEPFAGPREKLVEKFPDAVIGEDYAALVEQIRPDAVVVAGPDHLHAEQSLLALERGAHVLIEKPMATTVAEARALMDAEQKAGKQIMVDFTMRFSPPTSVIARMARNGEFGNIICLGGNYVHDMWHYYNPEGGTWYSPWRSDPKHPQSPLVGGGCHGLDLMLWIKEGVAVEEVFAYATELSESGLPIPDTYTLVMRFADGTLGKVFVTTGACGAAGSMLEVYGTTGSSINGMIMRRDVQPVPLEISEEDQKGAAHGWPLAVANFLDFLDGKIENPVPSRMGALNIAVFEAALDSIRTGQPVRPEQF